MTGLVVFLCAGTPASGAGHLSRCLALADAYRKAGWRVEFVVSGDAFVQLLGEHSWHVAKPDQAIETLGAIAPRGCDILVIDDYALDEAFESSCASHARRIVVLDDQTGRRHRCDVLIDAAVADAGVYRDLTGSSTRILAGPKYALIRSDILRRRSAAIEARAARDVANVLVSFGATDPSGLTLKVLDTLEKELPDDIRLTIALSSHARDIEAVRSRVSDRTRLLVDADMGEAIAAADLAVGAGGVGAFERAVLGLPGTIVAVAENQSGVARMLIQAGAALDGGGVGEGLAARVAAQLAMLTGDAERRRRMALAASSLIDGRAADRIHLACAADKLTSAGEVVRLRAAEPGDSDWLLALQREPATRRFARNPAPPSQQEHAEWFAAMLEKASSSLAIIETGGASSGMVRLDRLEPLADRSRYEISIAVSTAFHGRGIGSAALGLVRDLYPGTTIDAYILPQNEASLRMFRQAGYLDVGSGYYRSTPQNRDAAEPQHAV